MNAYHVLAKLESLTDPNHPAIVETRHFFVSGVSNEGEAINQVKLCIPPAKMQLTVKEAREITFDAGEARVFAL